MEEKLDFSLPEKKQKTALAPAISILLLLILIGLVAFDIIKPCGQNLMTQRPAASMPEEKVKELASKLAERNLYSRAAAVWQEYLAAARLSDTERAKALFQTASLLEKAEQYDQAIEYYYRSETAAKLPELAQQINTHIKSCFEKLGKFSALRYELIDRTSFKQQQDQTSKTVAEIGAEKITVSDLDALIERAIDNQLTPIMPFMTTEQLNEQKKKILEQYQSPSARQEFLQSWIVQEVLYRRSLEEKLSDMPQTQSIIEDLTRSTLSRQLMNKELADKINITETDLQTWYEAHKDRYMEPADANDPNSVRRQKSFDEVRSQVTSELAGLKTRDVQEQLIKQLMDEYDVIIHTAVFTPADNNDK